MQKIMPVTQIPRPGKPVRGSRSGAPIMALFDLLGRNWSMGIIWVLKDKPLNFRELQARCETVSPTTLNTRIQELLTALFVEKCINGYRLTPLGRQLFSLIEPVGKFAKKWGKNLQ
jgi:DNA-binding HxlR family transcriptional regulator